jgi:hypothetical protein
MKKALAVVFLIALIGFTALYTGAQSGRFSWMVVGGREAVTLTGIYRASVVTNFAGVATITCQADGTTIALPGAAVRDVVIATPSAELSNDSALSPHCRVSAPDVVTCVLCNPTGAGSDPASLTVNVIAIRTAAHR